MKKNKKLKKHIKKLKKELLELKYEYINIVNILKSRTDFLSNKIQSRGQ